MAGFSQVIADFWPRIAGGALIIFVSWAVAAILRMITRKFFSSKLETRPVQKLVLSTVFYLVIVLGLVTGLNTMGVKTTPIIAGLGLSGFALGFALKDVISNLLAGVLIRGVTYVVGWRRSSESFSPRTARYQPPPCMP